MVLDTLMLTRQRLAYPLVRTRQRVGHTDADTIANTGAGRMVGGRCRPWRGSCALHRCQHECAQHAVQSARVCMQDDIVSARVCSPPYLVSTSVSNTRSYQHRHTGADTRANAGVCLMPVKRPGSEFRVEGLVNTPVECFGFILNPKPLTQELAAWLAADAGLGEEAAQRIAQAPPQP